MKNIYDTIIFHYHEEWSIMRKGGWFFLAGIILFVLLLISGCSTSSQPPARLKPVVYNRQPVPTEENSPLPAPAPPTQSESMEPYKATTQPTVRTTEPVVTIEENWQVNIDYSGSWQGAFSYGDNTQSISGTGSKAFEIPDPGYAVSVSAQKLDDSSDQLSVQILKDGQVIASNITESPWGSAQALVLA